MLKEIKWYNHISGLDVHDHVSNTKINLKISFSISKSRKLTSYQLLHKISNHCANDCRVKKQQRIWERNFSDICKWSMHTAQSYIVEQCGEQHHNCYGLGHINSYIKEYTIGLISWPLYIIPFIIFKLPYIHLCLIFLGKYLSMLSDLFLWI